jgi:hypothetical protein
MDMAEEENERRRNMKPIEAETSQDQPPPQPFVTPPEQPPDTVTAALNLQPLEMRASGREAGLKQYHARLIRAGHTRNLLNEQTDLFVTPQALQGAVDAGRFEGLACFIDHTDPFGHPSIHNLFGAWSDAKYHPSTQAITATLTTYNTDETRPIIDRLDQILSNGTPAPDIGISLVFYPQYEPGTQRIQAFAQVESADLVFFPAADGRILEALSALNQSNGGNQMTDPTPQTVTEEQDRTAAFTEEVDKLAQENEERIETSAAWAEEIAQQGIKTILKNSHLPAPVMTRLSKNRYESPDEVYDAIREAREELQALDTTEVIDLGDRPWIYTKAPEDNIQEHVDWFFGVEGAKAPPSNYRKIDQLYIALTGDAEFHGVFKPDKVMLASATTTTLANMAVDAMNKVVMTQFSHLLFWRWFEQIALPIPNDGSVQSMKLITYGGIGNLPTVTEGAAYTELTVDDVKETASFTKKGGYVGITMEMIRNSNIIEIQAVPRALAIAAVRTRSAAVSAIFTSNSGVGPTLDQDSTALFHADHNNVGTTALAQAEWRVIRSECFQHTEVNSSKVLGVFPKFALLPAELYDAALVIFGYGEGMPTSYTPEAQARNVVDPRPVPLIVPDWTDANNYAYMVDPQIYPVIQISYAQSPGGGVHPPPELYTVSDENQGLIFTNDVMPIKVRDWFAVNVNGPRGIGKRNVA